MQITQEQRLKIQQLENQFNVKAVVDDGWINIQEQDSGIILTKTASVDQLLSEDMHRRLKIMETIREVPLNFYEFVAAFGLELKESEIEIKYGTKPGDDRHVVLIPEALEQLFTHYSSIDALKISKAYEMLLEEEPVAGALFEDMNAVAKAIAQFRERWPHAVYETEHIEYSETQSARIAEDFSWAIEEGTRLMKASDSALHLSRKVFMETFNAQYPELELDIETLDQLFNEKADVQITPEQLDQLLAISEQQGGLMDYHAERLIEIKETLHQNPDKKRKSKHSFDGLTL